MMKQVLGMGNALVDIMTRLENDALLDQLSLPKGSMQLVDKETSTNILEKSSGLQKQQTSGGSAANTINGLSKMGINAGFIGKVGNDSFGKFFGDNMKSNNIEPLLFKGIAESGRAIALVSPNSERTFATFLGAAIELSADDLSEELFKEYKYFHIEGYLVQNHDLLRKAVILAKQQNLIVSLDMASYNVVEVNIDFLKNLVKEYVDIVFANEEEAKAFTGKEPEEALNIIANNCEIAVVKIGSKGSLIKKGNEIHKIGVINADCVDTTGAGDLYAAGFIFGLINNLPLNKCGEIGSILSGNVIEVIGANMDEDRWMEIHKMVKNIL